MKMYILKQEQIMGAEGILIIIIFRGILQTCCIITFQIIAMQIGKIQQHLCKLPGQSNYVTKKPYHNNHNNRNNLIKQYNKKNNKKFVENE